MGQSPFETGKPGAGITGAPRNAPPVPMDQSAALDPANERDLWAGRSSWRAIFPTLLVWSIVTVVAMIAIWASTRNSSFVFATIVAALTVALLLFVREAFRVWGTSYRLTTQRLFVKRGILSQTLDQTELLRVDDVKIRQSLLQRLMGIGTVEIMSSDRSDKLITVDDLDQPELVAEHVRRNTRVLQKRAVFMEQI